MPDDAALVTAYLADRHVACPACGYDLCGAAGRVCPECGEALGLTVVAPARRQRLVRGRLRLVAVGLLLCGAINIARDAYFMYSVWAIVAFEWVYWVSIAFDAFATILALVMIRATGRGQVADRDGLTAAGLLVVYTGGVIAVSLIYLVVTLMGRF